MKSLVDPLVKHQLSKLESESVIINNKVAICNTFNNYFSSIGGQLAHNFVNTENPHDYMTDSNDIRFEFTPVTYEYVLDIVSKLTDSSAGYDMIPMWVYRNIFFESYHNRNC